jgi:hypothetical protein
MWVFVSQKNGKPSTSFFEVTKIGCQKQLIITRTIKSLGLFSYKNELIGGLIASIKKIS